MKRWFLLAATALGMATGCDHGPSQDACTQLLDHLVDLEFKKAGTTATDESQKADLAKQKAGVIESKSPEFMAACTDRTAKERVECALAASDLEAVAKCDETN
ncbi:MAG: hypothetical protein H6Q90_2403 [Deltaproteobacteria bacterium]|nr:hypothetical protein [Deltaproteobacteria bacterium]